MSRYLSLTFITECWVLVGCGSAMMASTQECAEPWAVYCWRSSGTPIHRLPGHGCASDDGVCLPTTGRREQPMCTYVPTDTKRLLQEIPIGGTSNWIPSANPSATWLFPCWDCRKNNWEQTGCYGKPLAAVILVNSKCIVIGMTLFISSVNKHTDSIDLEDEMDVSALNLGMNAAWLPLTITFLVCIFHIPGSFFQIWLAYLDVTVEVYTLSLKEQTKLKGLLEVISMRMVRDLLMRINFMMLCGNMNGMSFFLLQLFTNTNPPWFWSSFRRSHLNWPSEISDPSSYDEEPIVAPSPIHASPLLKSFLCNLGILHLLDGVFISFN